jgi:hypothetical protein
VSLQHLVASPNLALLNLTDTGLTPNGIRTLSKLTNLRAVALNNTAANDDCLETLSQLPNLEELYLRDAPVTDAGLQHLAHASKLRVLQLCGTQVSDAGLSQLRGLTSLRRLDLRGLNITDSGLASFVGQRFDVLLVQNTSITWGGILNLNAIEPEAREQLVSRLGISPSQRVGRLPSNDPYPFSSFQSRFQPRQPLPRGLPKVELEPDEPLGELL